MRDAELVTFGGSGLDRAAGIRRDGPAVAALAAEAGARLLPLWRGKPQMRDAGEGLALAPLAPGHPLLAVATEAPLLLGRSEGAPWFAVDVSGWEPEGQETTSVGAFVDPTEQRWPGLPEDHRFVELRAAMTRLSARDAEIAATARALIGWHGTHRFCARCGAASEIAESGWMRRCTACGGHHFPRTDPVVIMLVTHGNSVLVGRSPHWPEGMFSLLAGFVEPGETIEAAVRREVMEESGIRVGAVTYLASQPWPFPASLMIGCHGHAETTEICVDPEELEDARWVTRETMLEVMAGRHLEIRAARRGAIAHFLIEAWLADRLT